MENFSLRETPPEIRKFLESVGQQCINPAVDLSNYLLFEIGQPIHVFDARKVSGTFSVRKARSGEELTLLGDGDTGITLHEEDIVITDNDRAVALAGIKGGEETGADADTTDMYIEIASFDDICIRRTMRRTGLVSQAALRFSQGFPPEMIDYTAHRVAEVFGAYGSVVDSLDHKRVSMKEPRTATLSVSGVAALIGTAYTKEQITGALDRFGFSYESDNIEEVFVVFIPPERPDISEENDLIEEIGRLLGYDAVPSADPSISAEKKLAPSSPWSHIKRLFKHLIPPGDDAMYRKHMSVLGALQCIGFSEIMTSSFHQKGDVCVAYPVAKDKGCLRTNLSKGMKIALEQNAYNGELLGLDAVRVMEIGSVFTEEGEKVHLALGVRETLGRSKVDYAAIERQVREVLEIPDGFKDGVWEVPLADISVRLANDSSVPVAGRVQYTAPSKYPFVLRDVAVFVPKGTTTKQAEKMLRDTGGAHLRQVSLFDSFEKEGRVSYAFRMVFQSDTETLDDTAVNRQMNKVYSTLREAGYEIR